MAHTTTPEFERPAVDGQVTLEKLIYLRDPERSHDEVKNSFDSWAKSYDTDKALVEADDVPDEVITKFAGLYTSPSQIKVLDLGAGTRRMGQLMKQYGYNDIDGLDPSPKMLAVAMEKEAYNKCIEAFLGPDRLPIEDETYDLLISMGAFFSSHASPSCFRELIRITRPGGKIAIVWHYQDLYPEYAKAFREGVRDMESQNLWKQVDELVYNKDDPNGRGGILNVFQKC